MFSLGKNQFKYTQFWNELLAYVKSSVVIGNYRHQLKLYKDCFTGEDLVSNIYHFLKEKETHFLHPISRINAFKIGSIMMGQEIFKGCNTTEFCDDAKKFYVYSEDYNEVEDNIKIGIANKFFLRDLLMVKLLTLVDVPILEGILSWEFEQRKKLTKLFDHNLNDCTYNSNHTSTYNNFDETYNFCHNAWSNSALKLLHNLCVYDNPLSCEEQMPNELSAEIILKIQLFNSISEYYNIRRRIPCTKDYENSKLICNSSMGSGPLFPTQFLDIFTAILSHLTARRFETALDIIKLLLNLLPPQTYTELMRLLEFIKAVANDHSIQLEADISNVEICLKKFAPCIFDNELFSPSQSEIILSFIINNMSSLHEARKDFYSSQDHTLASTNSILSSQQENLKFETSQAGLITFCEQMSNLSFKQQGEEVTQNELYKLLEATMKDEKIGQKQKHKMLKKFKNAHPGIYKEFLMAHKVDFII